ncbi:zinc ABC transporter ATP-binding protein AztA [Rhodococcus sp. MEB064]|uniref:zinc ABC transporter ATP-binding protein AztA n=1 Tax=Rhodococcus sp. MEB064 TaxID=1587522 RepID=UPI0005B721E5|nr:zinc ABC transporter ATP-binding protein AztA [Rhodococcus sp. MEB064]KIQ17495.1 ABC transporter ATP-binding protein [Rhodococcus sp. MEB064]
MSTSRSEQSPAARLRGVRVEYSGHVAVRDVDLDVSPGAIMAIAGPNGAGKSTLLEVIAGTTPLTSGNRVATQRIAFVPQRAAVSDRLPLTVRDVVTVGACGRTGRWRRLDSGSRASVNDALDRLGIAELAAVPFSTLSGGQRQRALLAQGLAGQADLLLLDEPTTGLDTASGERIRAVMRTESRRGAAVVCVSHDPSVLGTADRVVTLEDGRIVS